MKKLSQIINEAKKKLDVQDDTINYISTPELQKYMEIADKFLSEDSKNVIRWLIDHPNYVEDLASKNANNALATFYDNGIPTTPMMRELYRWVNNVVKNNRLLEIPVFQTKEQFNAIISKSVSPDEVIIDLSSERGRNEVAKKYDALVWKIARSYIGKSNFTLDDLHAIGYIGLVEAMNSYGKKTDRTKADDEHMVGFTFKSYAGYRIRIAILARIMDEGHVVRIPRSQQARERKEKGYNTRNTSISVETPVGKDKEGNTKRLLDKISDYERGGKSLEDADNERLWAEIDNKLRKKFDDRTLEIFYSWFGLFGYEKLSGKEIMAKYGFKNPSNINANNYKVMKYMKDDPEMLDALKELYEFTTERQHDDDIEDRDFEPIRIPGMRFNNDENE